VLVFLTVTAFGQILEAYAAARLIKISVSVLTVILVVRLLSLKVKVLRIELQFQIIGLA
jgi:hypothetical protein